MKPEKLVMVVERKALFYDESFQGFRPQNQVDYESRILANFRYIEKSVAEKDPTYKQPVGYAAIVNPNLRQIFTYRRSTRDLNYPEKRLQGKWSWGVGGHIERPDTESRNPLTTSLLRELKEELYLDENLNPKVLGYINDDSNEVGRVHFGILYVVETNSKIVRPKDPEIDNGKLRPVKELEKICSSSNSTVEEWSRISLGPLKQYLQTSATLHDCSTSFTREKSKLR